MTLRRTTKRARFGQPMSLEEWANLPEGAPGELVDGRLVEEEVASFAHEGIVISLAATIRSWIRPRGGSVYGSEAKFGLSPKGGRKPDLSVFLQGTPLPPREGRASAPPDVMVEVISGSPGDMQRDRVEKYAAYAAFGVPFYWLIDPNARTLEIFELDAARCYARVLHASHGVVEVPGCAGLRLDLDDLWAEIDRLGPPAPVAPLPKRKVGNSTKRK